MTWLVALLAVAALLVVAEVLVHRVAHDRVAQLLTEAFGAPTEVVAPDRPVLPHLLRRRLPRARIIARAVPVRGGEAVIDRLAIDLVDVRLPIRLPGVRPVPLRAAEGRFEARLTADQLTELADLPKPIKALQFSGGSIEVRTLGGVTVSTRVQARSGALVIWPDRSIVAALAGVDITIPLNDLPAGAVVEDIIVSGRYLVAEGSLDGERLLDRGARTNA